MYPVDSFISPQGSIEMNTKKNSKACGFFETLSTFDVILDFCATYIGNQKKTTCTIAEC